MKRTHHCAQLSKANLGTTVSLAGWVDSVRDHGGIIFVDLRDREGVTQVKFDSALREQAAQLKDESVIGTAFYVMDCVEGRVLWDQALPGMTPEQRGAIWDELNRVIAQLHGIDYKAVGLEEFGKPGDYIARQVSRWSKQYRASELERVDEMDRLIEWLPQNIPAGDETSTRRAPRRTANPAAVEEVAR